jgi:hypothetical protein
MSCDFDSGGARERENDKLIKQERENDKLIKQSL